mmetsp:Transcript_9752/g.30114  ORF Transcript_9752/g.30114 Transcript_9752/m.30114 type:complete len:234 (+) Transcript_9752:257-958(+)
MRSSSVSEGILNAARPPMALTNAAVVSAGKRDMSASASSRRQRASCPGRPTVTSSPSIEIRRVTVETKAETTAPLRGLTDAPAYCGAHDVHGTHMSCWDSSVRHPASAPPAAEMRSPTRRTGRPLGTSFAPRASPSHPSTRIAATSADCAFSSTWDMISAENDGFSHIPCSRPRLSTVVGGGMAAVATLPTVTAVSDLKTAANGQSSISFGTLLKRVPSARPFRMNDTVRLDQ